ncbi:hypothetical protein QJQ45_000940 [Haematococcus lacustris]|nr:hypothetical protein QJQ45_000940 [Haematococcus lacustris]
MSEHKSKHSSHAAVGETRLRRVYLDIPDTVVKLPDGGTMTLRRRERSNSMPAFRKFNPRKMQPVKRQAGRQQGRQSPVSGLGAVMDAARNLPLSKLLLAATLAQHAFQALRGLWCRWRRRQRSRRLVRDGSGQLVPVMEEDEEGEGEEEGWEEPDPQALAAEARVRSELLPAMMRAALPKARRPGLAKQAAEAARSKARLFTTARQMMRPGPGVKRRPTSVLEKLDKAVQKQTRQLAISSAQQRREEQMRTLQALHDLHQATLRLPSTASTQQQAISQAGPAPVDGVSDGGSEATGTSTAAAEACPVDVTAPAMTGEDAGGCNHALGDLGFSSTSTPASSVIGVRRVR